jgi:hypothetical protein
MLTSGSRPFARLKLSVDIPLIDGVQRIIPFDTVEISDSFGEIDPVRRRAAIDEIFHEDAVFYEPNGAYRGRDEIDRIAGVIKATHPDFQYQPLSPPEEIGDGCRVRWVSGSPGKPPTYAGTDFIIVRDGKIAAVYLFFDKLPNRTSRK